MIKSLSRVIKSSSEVIGETPRDASGDDARQLVAASSLRMRRLSRLRSTSPIAGLCPLLAHAHPDALHVRARGMLELVRRERRQATNLFSGSGRASLIQVCGGGKDHRVNRVRLTGRAGDASDGCDATRDQSGQWSTASLEFRKILGEPSTIAVTISVCKRSMNHRGAPLWSSPAI